MRAPPDINSDRIACLPPRPMFWIARAPRGHAARKRPAMRAFLNRVAHARDGVTSGASGGGDASGDGASDDGASPNADAIALRWSTYLRPALPRLLLGCSATTH